MLNIGPEDPAAATIIPAVLDDSSLDTIARARPDADTTVTLAETDPETYLLVHEGATDALTAVSYYGEDGEDLAGMIYEVLRDPDTDQKYEVVDSFTRTPLARDESEGNEVVIEDEDGLAFLIDDLDIDFANHLELN